MTQKIDFPPIIFTDDGWIMGATEPPLSVQDLKEKIVDGYAGTGGALGWSLGDHELYHYETEVGEIFGTGYEDLEPDLYSFVFSSIPGLLTRTSANVRALIESCGGPMGALTELCRQAGVPFFPRFRMNSHYEIHPDHPSYGCFRRQHPELLIGQPGEIIPENTLEWGLRTGKNYAFPEVRDYALGLITESFERWDVDGVELDFMRHPGFFRVEEAYANRYLMTDLICQVRQRLHRTAAARGKELPLLVRVPPTLADSARVGVDVAHWIERGLVDIVIVGGGFIPFETPVGEFAAAARGTSCRIYGCIEATRTIDPKDMRALASRWWRDGADGIYLYNFYTMAPDWNERTFAELSSPATLAGLDKRYKLERAGAFTPCSGHSCGFRYASPSTQLPVILDESVLGGGPLLTIDLADDLDAARRANTLGPCRLFIHLENFTADDSLEVRLNRKPVPWNGARVDFAGWNELRVASLFWGSYPTHPREVFQQGTSVEFELDSEILRRGENEVEIGLAERSSQSAPRVQVQDLRLTITYETA